MAFLGLPKGDHLPQIIAWGSRPNNMFDVWIATSAGCLGWKSKLDKYLTAKHNTRQWHDRTCFICGVHRLNTASPQRQGGDFCSTRNSAQRMLPGGHTELPETVHTSVSKSQTSTYAWFGILKSTVHDVGQTHCSFPNTFNRCVYCISTILYIHYITVHTTS